MSAPMKFGSEYNFWIKSEKGTDLTRGDGNGKIVKTSKEDIAISPKKSALVIIDMQNYFLHERCCDGKLGREMIPTLIETVKACRKAGMPVVWCNMGFSKSDVKNIPPAYFYSSYRRDKTFFGQSIGKLDDGSDMGAKLARGSWNADLFGALKEIAEEGIKAGTDTWLWKIRYSGLTGSQPLNTWLEQNEITTTFFGGVNTDVCVYGTLADAYYLGYDAILVRDLAATGNPEFVTQTAYFATEMRGWTTDSKSLLAALE
ncbi:Isochorismatase hydrolase [Dacryopinax primogenitus]|uniref:Isochorismatase hydrolase n=1 Tax=Dacryopinax primogenitus (strain DJM 731) TaxID=1858805 RepID=M5FSQ5_DACPD|nr:Isochorismatase hydrolase [Dacryopinax primogenitus]EJU00521.1 Isochorismatase hydrolase [Dacryopinax primogenitus]